MHLHRSKIYTISTHKNSRFARLFGKLLDFLKQFHFYFVKTAFYSIFYTQKSNILRNSIAIIFKIIYNKYNTMFIKLVRKGGYVLFAKYITYR